MLAPGLSDLRFSQGVLLVESNSNIQQITVMLAEPMYPYYYHSLKNFETPSGGLKLGRKTLRYKQLIAYHPL